MNAEQHVPQFRFKGFSDSWEQRRLSNYITITGGNAWKSSDYSIDGDYLVVTISNVQGQRNINDKIGNKISVADPGKYLLRREDILVSLTGNVGRVSRMTDIPAVLNQRVGLIKLKTKRIDDEFLFQVLSNRRFESSMVASGQGAAQANISNNDVLSYKLLVPQDVREQSTIAHFFRNFDNTIALHQRKLELFKKLKRGYLQKLFPQDGENVPELRFKGYSDAWEKRKLGDLGSVAMNKRIYKDQTSDEGEIPFYKIGSFGKQADAFISRKLFNEYKKLYPFPKKGDILISASGSIGRTIVYNGEDAYFQDSNIIWIQHDNRLDNTFLHQLVNIIRWSGVEGTTIKRLYNKNILSTQILLPSVEEQRSIGSLLDNVDNLIAATQHKIDLLKKLKQGYLQRMFC